MTRAELKHITQDTLGLAVLIACVWAIYALCAPVVVGVGRYLP